MSFILDALRKSEIERQQESGSEFSSVPTGREKKKAPIWLWTVIGLLAINLAVLFGLLWRDDTPDIDSRVDAAVPQEETKPEVAVVAAPTTSGTASFEDQVTAAKRNAPASQTTAKSDDVAPANNVRAEIIGANPSSPSATVYPTLQTMIASGALQLPELHLDIHVFSDTPGDRFVFINMSKYREESQLEEGPVVHEITPEGVVLGHRGQFFLLPRD